MISIIDDASDQHTSSFGLTVLSRLNKTAHDPLTACADADTSLSGASFFKSRTERTRELEELVR